MQWLKSQQSKDFVPTSGQLALKEAHGLVVFKVVSTQERDFFQHFQMQTCGCEICVRTVQRQWGLATAVPPQRKGHFQGIQQSRVAKHPESLVRSQTWYIYGIIGMIICACKRVF